MIADIHENDCELVKVWSSEFKGEIMNTPDMTGYIIVYDGADEKAVFDNNGNRTIKRILPRIGELNYRMNSIQVMLRFLQAPLERIHIVNGGVRENYTAEFWLVPNGAEPPKPAPTLRKIQHRKIKAPKNMTYWDC